ncbi:Pseudouridylate synthase 1 homolog [Caenorhabditis elegans]|uniref:Pseudouridylate synthase 1 homolog n=2 Tax=Caenorhabditis elegans TaxID=6239 RepID=Q9XXN0_CAEEL|nr:Pseudouridine synthase I TruA alpha/beta domain-containing protein [Caenorhabditis elegans]CAA16518.1 Pseudouridine synthase I TruA alpha/beta domain-containing protein [Caenorhabditis elegans]|eukprot:NP_507242.1 tRNA pseudouridine synthase [Caenorhabditis elegans]
MTKTVEEQTVDKLNHVQSGGVHKEPKKPRVKQAKYAMLLGYQGKKYYGMQLQKDLPTIESKLLEAMETAGWITTAQKEKPFDFFFQRAARTDRAVSAARQMCGMQLPRDDAKYQAEGAGILNNILPADIRVFGMRRTTNFFHPQKQCDHRTYSYTCPSFVFAKPTELTNSSFRLSPETLAEVNSILSIYLGTHNFFNYTAKRAYDDMSSNRYIISFECKEPFLFRDDFRKEDVEFVQIVIKGQSFVLHQIRKMVGMVITVIRELHLKSSIQRSFEGQRMDIPMAPGLGLLLERTHYDSYDRKNSKSHEPLTDWGEIIEKEIERTKFELITKDMIETELLTQGMLKWLADLVHHDFTANAEAEEPEKKTFVTMAAACASKAAKEQDGVAPEAQDAPKEAEAPAEVTPEPVAATSSG